MKRAVIAIVDAACARLYTYQDAVGSQELVEEMDLINPGRRAKDGELFTDAAPRARVSGGSHHGSVDDHRDKHRDDMDAKFAVQICSELERLARQHGLMHVVFVTAARMLGVVRPQLDVLRKHGFRVDELARDLSHLTVPQIHDHLAQLSVIEPRRRVMQARR